VKPSEEPKEHLTGLILFEFGIFGSELLLRQQIWPSHLIIIYMDTYLKLIILFVVEFLFAFVLFYFVLNALLDNSPFSLSRSFIGAGVFAILMTLVSRVFKKN
jgi:glycerol uptake facilitator-like aquaporin